MFAILNFVSNITILSVVFCVVDVTHQLRQIFLSQALFHVVTNLANKLTVQRHCSLPILASYKHFNAICALNGTSSFVLLECSRLHW